MKLFMESSAEIGPKEDYEAPSCDQPDTDDDLMKTEVDANSMAVLEEVSSLLLYEITFSKLLPQVTNVKLDRKELLQAVQFIGCMLLTPSRQGLWN